MIVLVCGGRDYTNWQKVHALLDALHANYGISKIVQGCGRGTDSFASSWARINRVPDTLDAYKPDWDNEGRSAGIKRNVEMHDIERPDLVVGFEGGRGTAHMTQYAAECGTPTLIIPDLEWRAAQLEPDEDLEDVLGAVVMDENGETILNTAEPHWLLRPTKPFIRLAPVSAPTPAGRYDDEVMF